MKAPKVIDVKQAMMNKNNGRDWFSRENRRFSGDKSYFVRQGRTTKRYYLCRSTTGFTDMFGRDRQHLFYAVNELNDDLTIGEMVASDILTREELTETMKEL